MPSNSYTSSNPLRPAAFMNVLKIRYPMMKYVIYGKHRAETSQKHDRVISYPFEYPARVMVGGARCVRTSSFKQNGRSLAPLPCLDRSDLHRRHDHRPPHRN